jgi:surface antigen
VTLALATDVSGQSSGGAVFRIRNIDQRAILLTDLIVETNSPMGWQAFSHTTPTDPQRLAAGDTKDLAFAPPGHEVTWRLRVTYGKDVKGPMLLLAKVDYAISQHVWPNGSFGIMVGSNSCISEAMSK